MVPLQYFYVNNKIQLFHISDESKIGTHFDKVKAFVEAEGSSVPSVATFVENLCKHAMK